MGGNRYKEAQAISNSKPSRLSSTALLKFIQEFLDNKKAINIVTIDLSGKSSIADYLVIASGQSSRQVGSMAELLVTELKTHGELPGIEGTPQCEWVLVDVGDVVVHLFKPEVREFYNLEKMWNHIAEENESSEHSEHNVA